MTRYDEPLAGAGARAAHLDMIAAARRYLQAEFADGHLGGPQDWRHPGDRACTIEHWKALTRRTRDWHAPARLPGGPTP